jgi:putative tricarboxylic transport membrane protein
MVGAIGEAANLLLTPTILLFLVVGLLFGIFIGSIPGMGGAVGLAIALPLTFPLDGLPAIVLLVSIYSGAMYGGSIAAILINTPGTPAAAATTLDGYPMSRQGKAKDALAISAVSSALGGSLSTIVLILLIPVLVQIVLIFGSAEYFLVAILGLAMIGIVSQGSLVKGLTAGFLGLLLVTTGIAPMQPVTRYTFGLLALYDGLSFVAILIALFAIAEMIKLSGEEGAIARDGEDISGSIKDGVKAVLSQPGNVIKAGFIGMGIGSIPGAGSSVSNFVAYAEQMRSSSDNEMFGKGDPRGVIAAEASNNATVGGSLIPTLTFGIPGSGSTAVLLGGLLMHGLRPGPNLFSEQLASTSAIFLALLVGNLVILVFGLSIVTKVSYLTRIDTDVIIPIVIGMSFLAAFALRNNWIDLLTLVVLGIVGFYLKRHDYSIIAFVLGAVLGPIAESNFHRSLQISGGSFDIFFSRPISIIILILIVVVAVTPLLQNR